MLIDDIKVFTKNERELETQIQVMRIFNKDIGMEFAIEKRAVLISWKNLAFGEKENYKSLAILEVDTIKKVQMKDKIKKVYLCRIRKLHDRKLYCRNLIKEINTWAVPFAIYS